MRSKAFKLQFFSISFIRLQDTITVEKVYYDGMTKKEACKAREPRKILHLQIEEGVKTIKIEVPEHQSKVIETKTLKKNRVNRIQLISAGPTIVTDNIEYSSDDNIAISINSELDGVVSLCRHGAKKIIVLTEKYESKIQTIHELDYAEVGVDWTPSINIRLSDKNIRSGLYSITAIDSKGREFTTPIVIKSNKSNKTYAPILVIANTNTWLLYNVWGGRSRYRNFIVDPYNGAIRRNTLERLKNAIHRRAMRIIGLKAPSGIKLEQRWKKQRLSTKRPLENIYLNAASPKEHYYDHLAANEWRTLAWLEEQGFAYEYCSEDELIDYPLARHKVVILTGHSEYWTRESYDVLQSAVEDKGVSLVNISGNTIYQEVEKYENGYIHPCRGLFSETYKDPSTFLKCKTDLNVTSFSEFRINNSELAHWIYNGIASTIIEKERFGVKTLINRNTNVITSKYGYIPNHAGSERGEMEGMGASGWEVDRLCKEVKYDKEITVLAQGQNVNGGADIFIYQDDKRIMFAIPSIALSSALLTDDVLSRMLENMIKYAVRKETSHA